MMKMFWGGTVGRRGIRRGGLHFFRGGPLGPDEVRTFLRRLRASWRRYGVSE